MDQQSSHVPDITSCEEFVEKLPPGSEFWYLISQGQGQPQLISGPCTIMGYEEHKIGKRVVHTDPIEGVNSEDLCDEDIPLGKYTGKKVMVSFIDDLINEYHGVCLSEDGIKVYFEYRRLNPPTRPPSSGPRYFEPEEKDLWMSQ